MGNEGGLPNLSVNLRDKQSLFKSLLWDKKSKLNLKLSREQLVVCPSNFTLAVVHFPSALGHEKTFSPCPEYHDATTHVDRKVRIPPQRKTSNCRVYHRIAQDGRPNLNWPDIGPNKFFLVRFPNLLSCVLFIISYFYIGRRNSWSSHTHPLPALS